MKQLVSTLFAIGAVTVLTEATVYIAGWNYAPYIYTTGAGFIVLARANTSVKGKNKVLKCLCIQQIFGALALILAGVLVSTTRGDEWIACPTIAAVLELYTAFRAPQEKAKEGKRKKPVRSPSVSNRYQFTKIMDTLKKPKSLEKHFYFLVDEYLVFNPPIASLVVLHTLSA